MSKRFTDNELWQKQWFMDLSPIEKVAFFYIKDACDCVGVWNPNFKLADFLIGEGVNWGELRKKLNGNVELLSDGKWFIIDFVRFQYGELTEKCKPHKKYIQVLKNHGLFERVLKGYTKGIDTLQEKEEEKELEKDKEKEEEKESKKSDKRKYGDRVTLTDNQYFDFCDKYGTVYADGLIDTMNNYCLSKGKTYKNYYAALLNWAKKDNAKPFQNKITRPAALVKCDTCGGDIIGQADMQQCTGCKKIWILKNNQWVEGEL